MATKLRAAFDVDYDTDPEKLIQLYLNSKGQYLLSDAGQAIGKSPTSDTVILTSDTAGKKYWLPAAGEIILAIDVQADNTEVYLSKVSGTGSTEKITYSKWVFANASGYSTTGKPVALTLENLLASEVSLDKDLNDDDLIGNGISGAFASTDHSLYQMSSGNYVFSAPDQSLGSVPSATVTLMDKTGKKGWVPATGETVIAINDLGTTTDVYLSKTTTSGKMTTTAYSKWTFTDADGKAVGASATKLLLLDVLSAEKELNIDLTGDSLKGNAIVSSLATQESIALYKMTEGYGLSTSAQEIDAIPSTITMLMDKTGKKLWLPVIGESVVGINDDGTATSVYLSKTTTSGKTTTTAYSKWTFTDTDGKAVETSAVKLAPLDVLNAEKILNLDLTEDQKIGNAIVKSLADQETLGLYQMTEGYGLSTSGQEIDAIPTDPVMLMDKAGKKLWAPATGESVFGINDTGSVVEVLLSKTVSNKTTYSKWGFAEVDGKAVDTKPVVLSSVDLSTYETIFQKDLNGDGLITSLRAVVDTHVYDLILTPTDWTSASTAAKASKYLVAETGKTVSGALVSINDDTEKSTLDTFIATFVDSFTGKSGDVPYFWTSASDATKKGTWVWGDKTSLSTDTNWVDTASKTSDTSKTYVAEAVSSASDSTVLVGQYNNLVGTEKLAYVIEYIIA